MRNAFMASWAYTPLVVLFLSSAQPVCGKSLTYLLDPSSTECWKYYESDNTSYKRVCQMAESFENARKASVTQGGSQLQSTTGTAQNDTPSRVTSSIYIDRGFCAIIRDASAEVSDYVQAKESTQHWWRKKRKSRLNYATSLLYHLNALYVTCNWLYPMYPDEFPDDPAMNDIVQQIRVLTSVDDASQGTILDFSTKFKKKRKALQKNIKKTFYGLFGRKDKKSEISSDASDPPQEEMADEWAVVHSPTTDAAAESEDYRAPSPSPAVEGDLSAVSASGEISAAESQSSEEPSPSYDAAAAESPPKKEKKKKSFLRVFSRKK